MGKGKKRRQPGGDGCLFPFHTQFSSVLVSGANAQPFAPTNTITPRGSTEADSWAHFRVRSLKFRLHPNGKTLAVGFCGGVQDTPPGTIAAVMELLPSAYITSSTTTLPGWTKVPAKDLAGPLPWYKTVAGSADATEEAPGFLCVAGTGTDTFELELMGVLEFKTAVATANTPLQSHLRALLHKDRVDREIQRERALLLKILGNQTPTIPAAIGVSLPP